jgi:hypothetical protein
MKKTPWVCAHLLKTRASFFCQFHTSKFYLFGTAKYFYISSSYFHTVLFSLLDGLYNFFPAMIIKFLITTNK